jgi:acyl-CoA synthetase (AMP-forming)/AMP-acid ligase II
VRVHDPNDTELPTGQIGEVVTRSDLVMKGYWKDPEATAQTLKNGWLHTGDMGYLDDRGYLYLMDRSKDMIISGGENIYPREIEEIIIQHPAVAEVAIIGVPDREWGEAVKAIVALSPGREVSEAELLEYCQQHIASYKKPKSVDVVAELPKNNFGKIVKNELRERYWHGRERNV